MPLVKIETRRSREPSEKLAICEAVHSAMMEALKIPENDRQIRYVEHASEDFQVPPDKTENYTLVEITLFKGRTMEARRKLYKGIVSNLGSLGIAPEEVLIVLIESPPENWGIRGGVPASEVELGFKIEV
jgi:phenylpyruvate tautomerase PptA (4-oxalocrotonate tautomerase family)